MSRLSLIKGLLRNTGTSLSKPFNPLTAFYGAEIAGVPLGMAAAEDLGLKDPDQDPEALFKEEQEKRSRLFASQLKKNRLRRQYEQNLAALQMKAPHLYMSAMAGRRLPEGAVVLGGMQRQDLLQELAMNMGSLGGQDPSPLF